MWYNEILVFRDVNGKTIRVYHNEGDNSCLDRIESIIRADKNLCTEEELLVEYNNKDVETGDEFRIYRVQNRWIPASYYIEVTDQNGICTVVDEYNFMVLGFDCCKFINSEAECTMNFSTVLSFINAVRFMLCLGKIQIESAYVTDRSTKLRFDVALGVNSALIEVKVEPIFG